MLGPTGPAANPPSATPTPAPPAASPINPARDQQELTGQGAQRPESGELSSTQIFSEDWWTRARPLIELHGFFRTRAELFQNFSLGRQNSSFQGNDPQYLWPQPIDESYTSISASGRTQGPYVSAVACGKVSLPQNGFLPCFDKTESGANMRLRLDPEIIISDNLRIVSEVDLLDNVVMGSTPDSSASQPAGSMSSSTTGYQSAGTNAYAPTSFFATTQGVPTAGVNSTTNSISVHRVWAEYMTPVGQVRFGRMPSQWGLGMVDNAGDGIDSDYQTTTDRIMFVTGIRPLDLYFGGAWDFVATGPTALPGATTGPIWDVYGGQPYNTCNLCNVYEWAGWIARRTNPDLQRLALARGDLVVNGGLYTKVRKQYIDLASGVTNLTLTTPDGANPDLEARQAWAVTPDLWVQLLWRKLRIEAEAAMIWGEIGYQPNAGTTASPPLAANPLNPIDIREFGVVAQSEYRALDDKLDLQFGFGFASGDPWANNQAPNNPGVQGQGALQPSPYGVQSEFGQGPISTFRFHPDYRVDLIFFRNILTRVEGAYYFRPSVDYDFIRHNDGEKLGGGAAVIYSGASQFTQTPGHSRDLGLEIDAQIYYQSKDGSLNDDPTKIGGFYTMLQYGVFFPFSGLGYLNASVGGINTGLSAAQIVRLFLGVVF